MTALAGYWSFDGGDTRERCDRMLKAQAIYASAPPAIQVGGPIAVGRRLFKLLPEDRHDLGPVTGGGGRLLLAADVRLDNREELSESLGLGHERCRKLPDAALLMGSLEKWGEGAVERLVGDFAFALWDGDRQRLFLARDPLGHRPLHYHEGDGFFAFASMPKGLHALPELPYALDPQTTAEFLALMPDGRGRSFFEGIRTVSPGQIVEISRQSVQSRSYWRPSFEPLRLKHRQDYVEAVREALDRAVRAQLRGAGETVGAHLSAGLDSAGVAATAARLHAPGRVAAFTSVPRPGYRGQESPEEIDDEGPLAAATARLHPNIEHVLVAGDRSSPLALLDRYFLLFDQPALSLCNGSWGSAINDAARSRGVSVMLTGQMGNLSFSHDGMELLPELIRKGRLVRALAAAAALRRRGTRMGTIAAAAIGPFLSPQQWRAIGKVRGVERKLTDISAISADAAAGVELSSGGGGRDTDLSNRPRSDSRAGRLWALQRSDNGNLLKGILGGWGIDTRDPTADRRLIELCLRIPADQYLVGGRTRALAREVLADRLPAEVLEERRRGHQAADWHEGLDAARGAIREELERFGKAPAAAQLLDLGRMRALCDSWPDRGWQRRETVNRYRYTLLRGVSVGHFIRRVAGTND